MKNLTKNIKNVKYGSYTKKGLFSISNLKCMNVSYFSSISLNNKNIKKEIIITNYNGRSSEIKLNKRLYSGNIPHKILTMPALSPSMEKGVLVSWSKKVGDKVEAGDSLAKVETDKATLDFDATDEGYIAKLLVEDGTKDIPLGAPLAIIVSKQSDIKAGAELTVNTSSTQSSSSQQTTQTTSTPSPTPSTPQSKPKPSNLPPHKVLVMPSLSPSMEKGALVSWSKKVGDKIEAGDSLAKVETDKAVIDFDTTDEGYIAKLLVEDGTKDIPLGSPLAIIVSRESDIKAASEIDLNSISSSSSSSSPQQDTPQVSQTTTTTSSSSSSSPQRSPGDRIAISPRAKVVAKEKGFKVEEIRGTGPSGRVILRDVLSHQPVVSQQPVTQQTTQQTTKQSVSQEVQYSDFKQVDINNIRRITAERLTQSKQQIPHYYLTIDCNVDKLLSLRQSLNEKLSKEQIKISLNDMIIKASALSMRKVPQVNSHWYGDHIRQYNDVHINVAVDTERGLYVPVVRNAEKIGFVEINSQVKQLADKAKNNKISLEELQGGTFTISNLGMFGVNNFSAVINPPQSAILAVGTTEKRLVLKGVDSEGRQNIVESNFLKVTLSCDHRVIDGAVGAAWLSHFRSYVEDPITMLL